MSAKGLKLKQVIQADLDFREELRSANEFPAELTALEGGTRVDARPDAGAADIAAAPAVALAAPTGGLGDPGDVHSAESAGPSLS